MNTHVLANVLKISCRVGQARFERRPTICNRGVFMVGRRGEAPLVPPYATFSTRSGERGYEKVEVSENSGSRTRTSVPAPGFDSITSDPPSSAARSRMPASPRCPSAISF